jgi:lysophospholipase L1-like esterase
MAKKTKRKRAGPAATRRTASTAPDPAPPADPTLEPATVGERHLAYFEREAALSRTRAGSGEGYSDDADTEAWGVPGRTIIAEGDSWFDYDILGPDLIDFLRSRHGCHVIKNFARHGDTLENMVYGTEYNGGFQRRTPQFEATIALLREQRPRAFLFSGGGNDIAGAEFEAFLDHRESSDTPLRTWYADQVFGNEMPGMYERMISRVLEASPETHIFSHGYGNAIPSGVPAQFTLFTFGPWLRPALVAKGWTDLEQGRTVVADLIGRFNDMLASLARRNDHFHYVDLRPEIHDDDWENELHLGSDGYRRCAAKLYEAIAGNVPGWPE